MKNLPAFGCLSPADLPRAVEGRVIEPENTVVYASTERAPDLLRAARALCRLGQRVHREAFAGDARAARNAARRRFPRGRRHPAGARAHTRGGRFFHAGLPEVDSRRTRAVRAAERP